MKWIIAVLILILIALQYRLWFGEGSFQQAAKLEQEVAKQEMENASLAARNQVLISKIQELKTGTESIEAKAREDMGMIKEGETFYFIPEPARNSDE